MSKPTAQSTEDSASAQFASEGFVEEANGAQGEIGEDEIGLGEMQQDEEEEEEEQQEDQEGYESSSSPSTTTSALTWITWFCSLPGHEYFCEVAEDFIEDDFNLTGLSQLVPFYKEAMEMVLDVEAEEEAHRVPDVSIVESSAELLYGLIHQRFIITRQGLQQMHAKFDASHFGVCPRVYCSQTKLVPCGRSDLPGVDTVKLYCPSCVDMYVPPSSRFQGVDGAFFGTTFPHLLFQTYPSALAIPAPTSNSSTTAQTASTSKEATTPLTSLAKVYVPRIYGFRVSERARSGPRMQWLRMRPKDETELDWTDQTETQAGKGEAEDESRGKESGKLYDDEDDAEEDDEEEQEEEDAAGGNAPAAGPPDSMKGVEQAKNSPSRENLTSRNIRPLPRSSLSPTSLADSLRHHVIAAAPLTKPAPALVAQPGRVLAVKSKAVAV